MLFAGAARSAARYSIPTMYFAREFTDFGGLITYGTSLAGVYRKMGIYAGRILKRREACTVINLKTAKALGITVPPALLAVADEVIE